MKAKLASTEASLAIYSLLLIGLALMVLKDIGWLHTPHPATVCIAIICLALAILGLAVTFRQIAHGRVAQTGERLEKVD
jgi:hypothetical protein